MGVDRQDDADARETTSFETWLEQAAHASQPSPARWSSVWPRGMRVGDGRLQIVSRLGEGGMGVVYEAVDEQRRTTVALKTLSQLDAAAIYRLKNEFRALADLTHPNLVRLHEMFSQDEQWLFTMELVRGVRFDDWVRPGGRLDETRLRDALSQLVDAVGAIHAAGKLHRDLKPSNVMVTHEGRVVVLDFGLVAEPEPGGVGQTLDESGLRGTPAYMSPEQAAAEPAQPASDWYAVGVMLFEALTGRLPFEGSVVAMLCEKQVRPAPAASTLSGDVSPDLERLCAELLAPNPAARPGLAALKERLGGSRPHLSASLVVRKPEPEREALLGRSDELDVLRDAYETSRSGTPVWCVVWGESGMGKSALVEAFLSELRAQGDAIVLAGRCYERELVPFQGFDALVDDLTRVFRRLEPEAVAALLPRDVFALARLFPVLGRVEVIAQAPIKDIRDPQELRRKAFTAFGEMLGRMRDRRPVVAYIDDLQWLDPDSVTFLRHLLGQRDPVPLMFVSSCRSEHAAENRLLQDILETARRGESLAMRELTLGPLPPEAARRLAGRWMREPDDEIAARIANEAQGSPFFVSELSRLAGATARETPFTLRTAVAEHLDELPGDARTLLEVLAVAGRPLRDATALEAARCDHDAIDRLRGERLSRGSGVPSERRIECYHDKIRECVVDSLSGEALQRIHAELARVLLQDPAADPEHLATHCEAAGDVERAVHYTVLAADAAAAALAFDRAARLYRRALEGLERSTNGLERRRSVELELAFALSDGGRGAEAAPLLMQAALHAPAAEALELRRRAAEQWLVSGRTAEGLRAYGEVLGAVGLALPRSPRAALFEIARTRGWLALRGLGFQERAESEVPAAELLRIDACKTAWSMSFVSTIRASAFQAKHLLYALRAGEPYRIALGLGMEAVYASMSGARGEKRSQSLHDAARALAAKLDNPHAEAFMHLSEGQSSYLLARWERACECLSRADRILTQRCRNVSFELNSSRFFWGNALVFRGQWRELSRRLDAWLADARERGDLYATVGLEILRARSVTLASDDVVTVREQVGSAVERWRSAEFGTFEFLAAICEVQAHLYAGDAGKAQERIATLWPAFSGSLMPRILVCRAPAHHHAGYAALGMAREDRKDPRWLRVAASHAHALRREAMPFTTAFACQIEAALAQLRGQDERSAALWEEASTTFDAAQMHFYAAASRYRLGRLLGGDRGGALVAGATALYAEQGVAQPEAMARLMAPGLD